MRAPRVSWVALAAVIALLLPRPAHAYLDPGTGSMLLSALISVFVTAGFALQNYGYRVLAFFRGRPAPVPSPKPASGDAGRGGASHRPEPPEAGRRPE